MRPTVLSLALAASLAGVTPGLAGSAAYDAESVVGHLLANADLGAERGLCIGTENECRSSQSPHPSGFDMMVNFNKNSDELTEQAKANLDEFSKALKDERLASASFLVEGHTDATGPEAFNDALSLRRANSVIAYLASTGVPADRLKPVGLGESGPRNGDAYDPINRRVETRIEMR